MTWKAILLKAALVGALAFLVAVKTDLLAMGAAAWVSLAVAFVDFLISLIKKAESPA